MFVRVKSPAGAGQHIEASQAASQQLPVIDGRPTEAEAAAQPDSGQPVGHRVYLPSG